MAPKRLRKLTLQHLYLCLFKNKTEGNGKLETLTPARNRAKLFHQLNGVQPNSKGKTSGNYPQKPPSSISLTNQQILGMQVLVPDFICAAPSELGRADESTSEWILEKVRQQKPGQETEINVVTEVNVQKLKVFTLYSPKGESHDQSKNLAKKAAQNPSVLKAKWWTQNRK